ncbi:hypothetical protein BKI52_17335 [marine bacterium AO1-C]|nr:hypothetical protein BKI52_17335 [marine bacterium AO1-C]
MIQCKPKGKAIVSLGLFAVICYAASLFLVSLNSKNTLVYVGIAALTLLGLIINIRMFLTYKVITVDKKKLFVKQPYIFRTKIYEMAKLISLNEEKVKTFNDEYKELHLKFENGNLKISKQEYTDYEQLKSYVDKNKPKHKKKKNN